MAGSTLADLVGRVLAGRYRLLGAIGSGASGRVYVADDVRLRRRVAVKVLHSALADDTGFLRRFRSEAQLAASLHHPNIMAVYDWGEDGVPFMVLELLSGGSLRSMLDDGNRLTPAQAAHVGGQVSAALDYAHGRGLVHRDIKPANLLFDEHGIVRVADFGIARALAEASWTEPAGAVVGTARYAAPEQGTGSPLDGRADLYALGLVLVEAVTGSVPLVADTPLGTIGLRQESSIAVPATVGPLVPVVENACAADPDARYANADQMRNALAEVAERLPPPGPLVLAGLGAVGEDPHPTQVVQPAAPSLLFDQDEPARRARPGATRPVSVARMPARRSAAPILMGAVLVVAAAAIAFVLAQPSLGPTKPVPLLVGQNVADAKDQAVGARFFASETYRRADDPKGVVIAQSPRPGTFLAQRRTIHLVVSRGPKPIRLPDLVGKTQQEATQLLQAQFAVEVVQQPDEQVAEGSVISSSPSEHAPPDSTVTLTVSSGPPHVTVPQEVGRGYRSAAKQLSQRRFRVLRVDTFDDNVTPGRVVRTVPAGGASVPVGSSVSVYVSKGPDLVVVPGFKNMTVEAATAAATAAGVQVQPQGVVGPGHKVRAQDPPKDTKVNRGTVVTIFF